MAHLFFSTRKDVVSVCRHIGSIATYRIVSFRGEGFSVFVPTGMLFDVQFGPHHANTTWVVLCQRTAFVMSSIVSYFRLPLSVSRFCVACRARLPSIFHRCACVVYFGTRQTPTV